MSDKVPVRIMIIEGSTCARKRLTSVLAKYVLQVVGVANYFDALWHLGDFKPDLVILNEELPLLDGWESCYQLRQTFGIPVIIMGEDSCDESWVRALQAGADFYLKAPFSHMELVARAKTVMRR